MIDDLQDPDEEKQQTQFGWDEEFQRNIIALLMMDRSFLLHAIDLIKPNYFTNKAHQTVCDIIFEYYNKYHLAPTRIVVQQELKQRFKEDNSQVYYETEINSLYDFFEPSIESREYFTDKIAYFAKIQAVRKAFNKSLNLIGTAPESDETWSKVYDMLRQAMNVDKNFEKGLEYFLTLQERYERMHLSEEDEQDRFVSGYEDIDSGIKGGGYVRGEMLSIVGAPGVGKSVILSCISVANVRRGKKVLYISLELSEDRVAERFDAIMTEAPIQCLYDNRESVFSKLESMVKNKKDKNMIIIKHFPSSTVDVNTIRAYLAQLKFYDFVPDMIVVDYIGEMKDYAGLPVHESREKLTKELRGLADEEQVFLATAMQPNRSAKEAQKVAYIDEEHLADSYGQLRPLDGCISINQNETEKAVNVGKMFVIKQRFGKSKFLIYVKFDPETLQIYQISHDTYKDLMHRKKQEITESTEHDLMNASIGNMEDAAKQAVELAKRRINKEDEL